MISCTKGCFQLCAHNFLRPAHEDKKKTNLLLLQTSLCNWRRKPLLKIRSPSFPSRGVKNVNSVNNKATLSQVPLCCSRQIRQDNWSAFSHFWFFFQLHILTHIFFVESNFKNLTHAFCHGICRVFFHSYLAIVAIFTTINAFKIFCLFVIFWHVFTIGMFLSATDAIIFSHFLWLTKVDGQLSRFSSSIHTTA